MRSAAAVFIVLPNEEEWPNIVAGFSCPPRKPKAANFLVQVRTHFVPLN
jgi:hypothetical protein